MSPATALARRSAVLFGAVVVAVCGAALPAVAVPTYARDEPATAVATPSTVYLEATYAGYVRNVADGSLISRAPVVVTRRCSGVVVNSDGYVVTNTVCVQPSREVLHVNALYKLGRTLVQENGLAADQLDAFVARLRDSSAYTGRSRRAKPSLTLVGQLGAATSGATTAQGIPAVVTRALSAVDGNAALVKLRRTGLPAIEVAADAAPRPGDKLVILGYGLGEATGASAPYTVRTRAVELVGRTGTNRLGVDGQIGPDSRGGPVVDAAGRLVAVLDTDTSAAGEPIRDLITTANIGRVLKQADVESRLSGVDRGYRTALRDYFAGRYSRAVRRFDDLLRQDPGYAAARTYRDRAQERLDRDGDAIENSADWLFYLLSAAGGALVIGGTSLAQRLFRPDARTSPTVPASTAPASTAPTSASPGHVSPGGADARVDEDTVVLALDTTVILPRVECATGPEPGQGPVRVDPSSSAPHDRPAGHPDRRGHHDGP